MKIDMNELMDSYMNTDDVCKNAELDLLIGAYQYLLKGKLVEFYDGRSMDTMVVMHIGHRNDGKRAIFWKNSAAGTCAASFESMVRVVKGVKGDRGMGYAARDRA